MKQLYILVIMIIVLVQLFNYNFMIAQVNSWEAKNLGYGGNVYSVTASPNGSLFAGHSVGIFRSTNNGDNWERFFPNPPNDPLSISVNPKNNYIFAGLWGGGVYRSVNNGASWSQVGLSGKKVNSIVIPSSGIIFAASSSADVNSGGIHKSTDNGNSWSVSLSTSYDVYSLAIDHNDSLYAGTTDIGSSGWGQVLKSADTGKTWRVVGWSSDWGGVRGIVVDNSGNIFISASGKIFKSSNNGTNWNQVFTGIEYYNTTPFVVTSSNHIYVGSYYAGGVYRSLNGGGSWTEISSGLAHLGVTSLMISSGGTVFAGGGAQFVHKGVVTLPPGSISGMKFNDLNGNSVKDGGEPGLSNWTINLSGTASASTTTDVNGNYSFPNLSPGTYTVSEVAQSGWTQTFPSSPGTYIISISSGQNETGKDFGNRTTQNAFLILDANNNPIRNKELEFYKVNAQGASFIEDSKGSSTTDNNGMVYFSPARFVSGDTIKVHKVVWGPSTTRPRHKIKIDNGKFDVNGKLSYDPFNFDQPQSIKLDHTTVMYDLTVSIEWDATSAYLDSLERGLRYLSNYLYDVFDGQLFIESVTIYDNSYEWNNADIRIHATNDAPDQNNPCNRASTDQISGHIEMPRIFYMEEQLHQLKATFTEYPYTFTKRIIEEGLAKSIYTPIRSIAHEFGHLGIVGNKNWIFDGFKDEYDSGLLYNFGLMSKPYDADLSKNSEMSSEFDYIDSKNQVTRQWKDNKKSCWDYFRSKFQGDEDYDGISVSIKTPPPQMFSGPNNDIEDPQYDVGALMDIQKINSGSSQNDFILTVIDHKTKEKLSNVFVRLEKNNPTSQYMIEQGYTHDLMLSNNNKGNIRLLGLNIGDKIYCTKLFYITSVTEVSTLSNILVELTPSFAPLDFVPTLQIVGPIVQKYTHSSANNSYVLSLYCPRELRTPPTLEIFPGNMNVFYSFMYDQTLNKYVAELPDSIPNVGLLSITALDDSAVQHQSFLKYSVSSLLNFANSNDGKASIKIDTINNTITNICISSSDISSNFIGVEDKAIRAGDVYSITSFPNVSTLAGENTITISYSNSEIDKQKEASIRIFRFDQSQRKWEMIGGTVDTARKKVTADIQSLGTYAAFTTLEGSSLVAYYPFSGNANDSSGNGNDGTTSGGVTWTTDRFGHSLSAAAFDGTSGQIVVDSTILDVGWQEYTISAWFSSNNISKTNQTVFNTIPHTGIALNFNHAEAPGYFSYFLNSDPPAAHWNIATAGHGTFTDYQNDRWYNIVFIKNVDTFKLYVNGILDATLSSPISPINYLCGFKMGEIYPTGDHFSGKLDDYRIYNRALAKDEIDSLYHEGGWQPPIDVSVSEGWNMLSVPVIVSDYRKYVLFPSALSDAFTYLSSYVAQDTLKNGPGYWLKFSSDTVISFTRQLIERETVEVHQGWNMIGSISSPVPVNMIGSLPGEIVTSDFFGYNGSTYAVVDTIEPGYAYWVRVSADGELILSKSGNVLGSTHIRIVADGELPPPPPEVGERTAARNIPTEFGLEQNYPNPFNPATIFKYALPYDSKVTLRIYNTLGQVVMRLVDNVESVGFKSVEWNASHMASGVYFYRLEATNINDPGKSFIHVRKMLLIK